MSIIKKQFGFLDGKEIFSYTLNNAEGLEAEILSLGGIIRRLVFNGTDVVLGHSTPDTCHEDYLGALVGRNSNRIEGCEFELNGKIYTLAANDSGRNNNLHGGRIGFSHKIWEVEMIDETEPKLVMTMTASDGEEGYPGNVEVKVTYTLTKQNSIKIHYEGTTDADTIMNLTNHAYFNLNGHTSGDVKNHTLMLNSSFYTPLNSESVPDGRVLSVLGTPFDFKTPKTIGKDMDLSVEQLALAKGYDHNFSLDSRGFRKFAEAEGDLTHIVMECFTDLPAVQLYTGNFLELTSCKDNANYAEYAGFCLETQVFPNAMKYSFFPSPILKKGEKYDTTTEYKFLQK